MRKEYKISLSNDDRVTPEETLIDSGSEYSDLEKPISHNVFRLTFFISVAVFSLIFAFSFKLAISEHEEYARLAFENKSVNFFVPPPRGIIFDRLGRPLVKNLSSFDLLVISKGVREITDPSEIDPVRGREGSQRASASNGVDKVADILKVPRDKFRTLVDEESKNSAVFFAAKELSKDQVLNLRYLNLQGFYVIPDAKRYYVDGHQFSAVLGYLGKVNKDDLNDNYYKPTDIIGRLGVEAQYEELLRGEHGKIFFSPNGSDKVESPRQSRDKNSGEPLPGQNLVLNIDYDLQKKLYNELYGALTGAGLSNGAAIIQNPQNGRVLAMVSFPSYDNNLFASGLSDKDFKNLFESRSRPLFNRVVSGLYNPGSVIKPFIGLMALQESIFKPSDTIRDCVSLTVPNQFDNGISYVFNNWREEKGLFNLRKAIANSCNIYFFIAGGGAPVGGRGFGNIQGLGIEKIAKYLTSAWADKILGIDLPGETKGFVPTPDWKEDARGEPWYQGDTYNISIGQGDLLITPLWLNSYISAIALAGQANEGIIYRPQISKKEAEELLRLPFKNDVISEIKSDMEETVISGTARILQNLPVRAGAKTGTAEVVKGRRINALFAAFAPFDNPEVSITVLVEGASSNQGLAIVVADNVLKWYFEKD